MYEMISREKYLEHLDLFPLVCVDLIILNEDKYLLCKRKNSPVKGMWWFPGGRIFKNEKLHDAAIRSAKEETGLDVVPRRLCDVCETIFDDSPANPNSTLHTINAVYLCHSHSNEVILDDQHSEYKWVSISIIPNDLDKRLHDALEVAFGEI